MTGLLPRADKLAALAERAGWRVLLREYGPAGEHRGRVLLTARRGDDLDGNAAAVQWRLLPTNVRTPEGLKPRLDENGERVYGWSEDWCYLWRREHSTVARSYVAVDVETRVNAWTVNISRRMRLNVRSGDRELWRTDPETVSWRSEHPTPDRVSVTELKAALATPVQSLIA